MEQAVKELVRTGVYEKGASPGGSWAFPTRRPARPSGSKRRVVVDYRVVNRSTVRSEHPLRRSDDIKAEAAGSVYYTVLDAVKGFNQVRNTPRASLVHAVLTHIGSYRPLVLTLGPTNGPEDFSKVVDLTFAGGRFQRQRLCRE